MRAATVLGQILRRQVWDKSDRLQASTFRILNLDASPAWNRYSLLLKLLPLLSNVHVPATRRVVQFDLVRILK
ncbi:MAG TPA: hypothetical protein VMG09_06470 [Bacteroidota bacterium]|nr:hypothetical protein [Bacteroidota bacterium]